MTKIAIIRVSGETGYDYKQQDFNYILPTVKLMASSPLLQFLSSRGNEYFCEIDEEYLTDRFNLTGLNMEVQHYQHALDLVTDVFDLEADDDLREQIEKSARHLYGLAHARYIVTTRGLSKMVRLLPYTNGILEPYPHMH